MTKPDQLAIVAGAPHPAETQSQPQHAGVRPATNGKEGPGMFIDAQGKPTDDPELGYYGRTARGQFEAAYQAALAENPVDDTPEGAHVSVAFAVDEIRKNSHPSKAELLEHYATKKPTHFLQFDGWEKSDDPFTGSGLTLRETWELMSGTPGIRVLLPDHTTQAEAVAMLRDILDYIAQYPPRRFAQERQGIYTVDNVVVLPRRHNKPALGPEGDFK